MSPSNSTSMPRSLLVEGIDLFCGAGGLTYGLQKAGVRVVAGVDLDPLCRYPFTTNNGSAFIEADVRELKGENLAALYSAGAIRLLAGCAPCRPFSPFRRRNINSRLEDWGLLREFSRLVQELEPEFVTIENVPDLRSKCMFARFVGMLRELRYHVDEHSVYCPPLGVPQHRRRLVLLASRIGLVAVPSGSLAPHQYKTVRQTIGRLPQLEAGESDPHDRLHRARSLSVRNLARLQASRPGGTWKDWTRKLRAPCHRRRTGASYRNVYARMAWDEPSPTITTLAYSFGSGRFGHPEQPRAITPREAALLQTFPRRYRFVAPTDELYLLRAGRLIGNAVPPLLGYHIGKELMRVASEYMNAEPHV